MEQFEHKFEDYMAHLCREYPDPSHDLLHVKRVVRLAKKLADLEGGDMAVITPAAYLHDCVYISKSDPRRSQASRLSADKALELLEGWEYPSTYFSAIHHAISAHSFSSGIKAESLEAQIVQDADRLDAMGAVGIFRCFSLSGKFNSEFYSLTDPFCKDRTPDDKAYALDHFYAKLLRLQDRLNTESARQEGLKRVKSMKMYLNALEDEITM